VQWHIGQAANFVVFPSRSNLANTVSTVDGSWSKIESCLAFECTLHAQDRRSRTTLRMKSPIQRLTPIMVEQITSPIGPVGCRY